MNSALMTLFSEPRERDWQGAAAKALVAGGFSARIWGRGVDAWPCRLLKLPRSDVKYCDGVSLHSIWLGPRTHGLTVTPRRYYFRDRVELPSREPEHVILGSIRRPLAPPDELISSCLDVGRLLAEAQVTSGRGVQVPEDVEFGLVDRTRAVGANGSVFPLETDMWRGLKASKLHSIPEGFRIICIKDDQAWNENASQYVRFLETEWLRELGVPNAAERVSVLSIDRAIEELAVRVERAPLPKWKELAFLVGLSGGPGDRLPQRQSEVIDLLDRSGYQFRAFSLNNNEPKWSARGQVASLIQAAGGVAYQLTLPVQEVAEGAYYFGIDLGHAHRQGGVKASRVVVSVLDRFANFLCAVFAEQVLNEAMPGRLLVALLRDAKLRAESLTGEHVERVIAFRDGRIPAYRAGTDQESPESYREAFGEAATVLEVRKGENPVMYLDGPRPWPAPAGTALSPANSEVRFVVAHDALHGVPTAYKLHIPRNCDGLGIGLRKAAHIVTGLCYSPSLGLRPHLPGPIYWADGIASTASESYKFRGQRVYHLAG